MNNQQLVHLPDKESLPESDQKTPPQPHSYHTRDTLKPSALKTTVLRHSVLSSAMERLPEELLFYIFEHVNDFDLQALARTCTLFRRLSSDMVLWRHYRFIRNPLLISSRLFSPQRPARSQLLRQNILCGISPHQLERGDYVMGETQQRYHETRQLINRLLKKQALGQSLRHRSPVADLQDRGVLLAVPESVSPLLLPRLIRLKKALRQAMLHRQLRRRASLGEVKGSGILPMDTSITVAIADTKCKLEQYMKRRPSVDQLEMKHVIDARTVAQMICPSVQCKIEHYEGRQHSPGLSKPMILKT